MFNKVKVVVVSLSALFVAYGLVGGMLDKVSARDDTYQDLSIFMDVLSKVQEDYVEKPDMEEAIQGALHGMMEALDPYSSFIDRVTYERLEKEKEGLTASPGIILSKRYGYAYVVSVLPGSAAEQEGLRAGDMLESIEGKVTTKMSLWEARKRLTGEEDTSVNLRLVRTRRSAPKQIELVRKGVRVPEISARLLEEGVGFLLVPHFEEGSAETILSKLKMLQSMGVKGLLIDIRGTALGVLQEAIKASDLFLTKGEKILTVKNRKDVEEDFFSLTKPSISDIPVIVLFDGGTSGVAEIFAAALKDQSVAKTIGQKTNGQGAEQRMFHLEDGSVMEISNRLFYRATGSAIQGRNLKDSGISPDIQSPSQDFVTSFYFENTSGDATVPRGDSFYRKLNRAIRIEQFEKAMSKLREQLLKEAA